MDELIKDGIVQGWPGRGTFLERDISPTGRRLTQVGIVLFCARATLFRSPYLNEMFQGIMLEAEAQDTDARIFSIRNDGALTPRQIAESGVDGVILVGIANEEYIAQVAQEHSPVVVLDNCTESVPVDYVVCDNVAAAWQTVEHLVKLGHKRIAYVDGWTTDTVASVRTKTNVYIEGSDNVERREGYLKGMRDFGLTPLVYGLTAPDVGQTVQKMFEAYKAAKEKPTALITSGASGDSLIKKFAEFGVQVPRDLSIAAVAGSSSDAVVGSQFMTYHRMHFVEMGQQAMKILAERCGQLRPTQATVHRIGSDFIIGNTTGPAKEN
jgi:LacI family transcriptional regulator